MPENARLNDCLDRLELEFVEREATPPLLMTLSIQLHLANLLFSNTILSLKCLVSNERDRPFTTGFTKPIYSPTMVEARITLRSMRP